MFSSTRVLLLATALAGFMAAPVFAATTTAPAVAPTPKTAQQQRMTTCNKEATGKKGDERKTFMSSCLKGDNAQSGKKLTSSQERMKTCNADAKTKALKGDARKTFMSTCLKSK